MDAFYSFSCLTALTRISSVMLNVSSDNRYLKVSFLPQVLLKRRNISYEVEVPFRSKPQILISFFPQLHKQQLPWIWCIFCGYLFIFVCCAFASNMEYCFVYQLFLFYINDFMPNMLIFLHFLNSTFSGYIHIYIYANIHKYNLSQQYLLVHFSIGGYLDYLQFLKL